MSIAISVHLKNKNIYLIGGGNVAYRKACAYQKEGARLTIIAPQVIHELNTLEDIRIIVQPFSWNLVENAFMIYVATNNECLNAEIVKEAEKRNILCGCANHLENASFSSMKQQDYTHLQIAISTKSSFPYANKVFLSTIHPQLEHFNRNLKCLQVIREHILSNKIYFDKRIWQTLSSLPYTTLKMLQKAIVLQKKMVILAYHGVADIHKVASDMMKMNTLCEHANIFSINAFISTKIVLKAKGYEIDALETITRILDTLRISYVIQPMLISNGAYMEHLQTTYAPHMIGNTLCEHIHDIQEITAFLLKQVEKPLYLLYHRSESDIAHQLKQQDIHAFSYDEEVPVIKTSSITIQSFSVFIGYHAHKDIELKWLTTLENQGISVTYIPHGLLSYEFIRMKFMQRIQTII